LLAVLAQLSFASRAITTGRAAPDQLTLHHAIEINVPIGCGDAPVFPGDVISATATALIVIPAHLADEIANEAVEMTAFEDFVTEEVRKGRSILGLYPPTDEQTPRILPPVAQGERAIIRPAGRQRISLQHGAHPCDVQQSDRRRMVVRWRPRAERQSIRYQGHRRRSRARHACAGGGRDCRGKGRISCGARSTPQVRYDILKKASDEILARKDDLWPAVVAREGKTLPEGVGEVARAGQYLCVLCRECLRMAGRETRFRAPGIDIEDHPRGARRGPA